MLSLHALLLSMYIGFVQPHVRTAKCMGSSADLIPPIVLRSSGVSHAGFVNYELSDYVLTCDADCGDDGACRVKDSVEYCECHVGFEGEKCELSACPLGCAHGGICTGANECECGGGWVGEACGTAEGSARVVIAISAGVVSAILVISCVVAIIQRNWLPIRARGPLSLVSSHLGGLCWSLTAVTAVMGEPFGYSVNDPLWTLWMPLVAGFGLWLASNLAYMRTMVQVRLPRERQRETDADTHTRTHSTAQHSMAQPTPGWRSSLSVAKCIVLKSEERRAKSEEEMERSREGELTHTGVWAWFCRCTSSTTSHSGCRSCCSAACCPGSRSRSSRCTSSRCERATAFLVLPFAAIAHC